MEGIRGRLRELRVKLNVNQCDFAQKMGVKQTTWSNIETGINPCSDRYVNLICLTYNVRKEWLLTGQGTMFEPQPKKPPPGPAFNENREVFPPEVLELISIYQELVPLNQKAVLDFVETTLQSQRNTIESLEGRKSSPED